METTAATNNGGNGGNYGAFRFNSSSVVNFNGNTNLTVGTNVVLLLNGAFVSANAPRLTITTGGYVDGLDAANTVYSLAGAGTYALSLGIGTTSSLTNSRSLTINGVTGTTDFTGLLQDGPSVGAALSLAKTGASTQQLSGANTYTGGTILAGAGGTLIANHASALGAAGSTIYIGNANNQNCGTLQFNVAPANPYNVVFGGTAFSGYQQTNTIQLNYAGSPNTTATLGTLNLGQQNMLNLTAGGSATGTPVLNFAASGNIFGYSVTSKSTTIAPVGINVILGSLTASNTTTAQTSTLVLDGTSTGNQINGVISDSGSGSGAVNKGAVAKQNTSTWILSGNNNFTGGTTLSAGTLIAATNASVLGTGALALNGGTLDLQIDSSLNALNTTVGGTVTIQSDKASATSAGITHTLGTLGIGANQLNVAKGGNVSDNGAGLVFGTVTATGAATYDVASGVNLTLGALSGAY